MGPRPESTLGPFTFRSGKAKKDNVTGHDFIFNDVYPDLSSGSSTVPE